MASTEVRFDRVLIDVIGVDHGEGDVHEEGTVRAVVFTWRDEEVPLPVGRLNWDLMEHILHGGKLLAEVNLGAQISEELYMRNFEKAPPPISESELMGSNHD